MAKFSLRINPYPLTSAYVKVLPKTILAAGDRVIVLVCVLADVLVGDLPLESIFKAIVAKFPRRAQTDENR